MIVECLAQDDKNTILRILAERALDLEGRVIQYRADIKTMRGYDVEPDKKVLALLEGDLVDQKRLIKAVHGLKVCR